MRTTVALALLIGVAGGVVLASFAGARRTGTAYDRFLAGYRHPDVLLPNPDFGPDFPGLVLEPAEVAAMPQVAGIARGRPALSEHGAAFAAADDTFGFRMPQWRIVDGRPYDTSRFDEVVLLRSYAASEGISVGDRIDYPGQAPPGAPPECSGIAARHQISMTVVGIATMPGVFFEPASEEPWTVLLTPAMHERLPALARATGCEFLAFPPTPGMMWVDTHPGETDAFVAALEERAGDGFVITELQAIYHARNRDSLGLQAMALWVLGGAAALAALLILSQTIARQLHLEGDEHHILRSLGMTRWQLFASAQLRVVTIASFGAVIAFTIAVAASPLLPLGAARIAEPAPGLRMDALVLGAGTAVIVLLLAAIAVAPSWSLARGRGTVVHRGSRVASTAARAGLPAPVVAGVRMALESGRGRSAVPVRTTIASIALGLAMLTGALTFGSSTTHLLDSPAAYGLTVDVWIHNDPDGFPFEEHIDDVLASDDVAGAALGTPGDTVLIEGRSVEVIVFEPIKGDVQPQLIDGAYPLKADEIALGTRTARRLGLDVGDRAGVRGRESEPGAERIERSLTVVGIAEIPPFERGGLGEGAVTLPSLVRSLQPDAAELADGLFVRIRDGVDQDRAIDDLKAALGKRDLQHFGFQAPADVVDFGRVRHLPAVLAGVLGMIAAGALAHVLVTAVRRRRRDIAILKTMGFARRQASTAVAWQASTTVLIAIVIGLPAGVVLGRWAWSVVIGGLGLVPEPSVPFQTVAFVAPGALILANVMAAFPARSARRTSAAAILRAE